MKGNWNCKKFIWNSLFIPSSLQIPPIGTNLQHYIFTLWGCVCLSHIYFRPFLVCQILWRCDVCCLLFLQLWTWCPSEYRQNAVGYFQFCGSSLKKLIFTSKELIMCNFPFSQWGNKHFLSPIGDSSTGGRLFLVTLSGYINSWFTIFYFWILNICKYTHTPLLTSCG